LKKKTLFLFFLSILFGFFILDKIYPPNLNRFNQTSYLLLDENNEIVSTLISEDGFYRFPVQIEDVSKSYLNMLIAFEDKRFYYHPGIDPIAMCRALWQFGQKGKVVSGGSTLTLQVVRLLEPRKRTFKNKLLECFRALQLEYHFSKKDILRFYLTLAPYGSNIEGVRAASLAYFGKEPKALTVSEAAFLIAIPQKPSIIKFKRSELNLELATKHRDKVIERMEKTNDLSQLEIKEAKEDKIPVKRFPYPRYAQHIAYYYKYHLDEEDISNVNLPKAHLSKENLLKHKKSLYTSLNLPIQIQLESYLKNECQFLEPTQTIAAIIVNNETQEVKAYVGSADFYDEKRFGQIDMVRAIRSPGSLLKPFIYATAFDEGIIHPDTLIQDIPTRFGQYAPSNLKDIFHGTVSIREALQQSLNIPAIAILDTLGPARFCAHLKSFGVTLKFEHDNVNPSLPIGLGGVGMRLWDLVNLYTALANEGKFQPIKIEKHSPIYHKDKKNQNKITEEDKLYQNMLTSRDAALEITRILEEAPAPEGFVDGRAVLRPAIAFKTGTSYGYRDAFAIGYTRDFTVGVWVGKPDGTPSLNQLGRTHALPILFRIFHLLPKQPNQEQKRLSGLSGSKSKGENSSTTEKSMLSLKTKELPYALREFIKRQKSEYKSGNQKENPLKLFFPTEGSVIQLEVLKTISDNERKLLSFQSIPISFSGGKPPYYLFENGQPHPKPYHSREIPWKPEKPGFYELTLVDSEGHAQSVNIELKQ